MGIYPAIIHLSKGLLLWQARQEDSLVSKKTFSVFGGTNRDILFLRSFGYFHYFGSHNRCHYHCVLGQKPIKGYALLFSGSVGSKSRITDAYDACPLIFTSLCAPLHISAAFFNLGGEGQFVMGATCAIMTVLGFILKV